MPLTRHHATAFLDPSGSHPVEELRRAWDPEMARQIAGHIMLIYPGEITDPAELAALIARAAAHVAPFSIALDAPFHVGSPADGDNFAITEVAITAYDGDRRPTLQTIPLTGRQPPH